eukprot:scaffold651_cov75-Phaeocystis_antarctica.AAC.1
MARTAGEKTTHKTQASPVSGDVHVGVEEQKATRRFPPTVAFAASVRPATLQTRFCKEIHDSTATAPIEM